MGGLLRNKLSFFAEMNKLMEMDRIQMFRRKSFSGLIFLQFLYFRFAAWLKNRKFCKLVKENETNIVLFEKFLVFQPFCCLFHLPLQCVCRLVCMSSGGARISILRV